MTSAPSTASAGDGGVQPSASARCPTVRPGPDADDDVEAGLAQVQGVGVALRAVAEDGDAPAAQQVEVGVGVVKHVGMHQLLSGAEPAAGGAGRRRGRCG